MDIKRYEGHRVLGTRDTMIAYDVSDEEQATELLSRIEESDLFARNLIQTFAPDTLAEARNRGFKPMQ